ncbi:MAG: phosphoserine phosphatase SerB [Halieaceae bacterium]|jgi:phosphoserine phosphatase|nr:phosphoserine phosphatase SerB [Halieaceae bacterium]
MHLDIHLGRPLERSELLKLLPALLCVPQVSFGATRDVLSCDLGEAGAQAFDARLIPALDRLELTWQKRDPIALPRRLYESADAVVTLQCSGAPDPASIVALASDLLAGETSSIRGLRSIGAVEGAPAVFEIYLQGVEHLETARERLAALRERGSVDINLTHADLKRPRRRLIVFDMDSTLIDCEVIDELAARAGVGEEVAAITARAMRGELDFRSSFRERMARLKGLSASVLEDIASQLPIMPGAEALLRALCGQGHYTAILSGGFDYFAREVQARLGIHEVHANRLQLADGALTGEVEGAIVDGARKVELLEALAREQGFDLRDTVAVGDGANDIPMLTRAGLGVAFHAKPLVRERAPCAVSYADLTGLLGLLGDSSASPEYARSG